MAEENLSTRVKTEENVKTGNNSPSGKKRKGNLKGPQS